ncbi:hypothetical protein VI817_006866 [Penicillium citrinum]|nr:hypothetical protein VI817_006866 [Penicillium citrinum]
MEKQGEEGGRNAAKQLSIALNTYLTTNLSNINVPKLLTKIYMNVRVFGEMCTRSGIVADPSGIHDFIRGFNETMSFSEIVDIGSAKNTVLDKMKAYVPCASTETLQVFLYNCHCHQIFLGCPSNTEYTNFLEDILKEGDLTGRISLVEGVTFEKELETVKNSYRIAKFPEIFRSSKLAPTWAPAWKTTHTLPSRSLLTPSPSRQFSNPPPLSRTSTNTSFSGAGAPLTAATPNEVSGSPDDFQVVRPKAESSSAPAKSVERNKYGQRVDRLDFKSIPRDELNRLKKLKLCNYYFLLGECPNEENCYHDHDRKLTRQELHILSAIARMTPCRFGLECDDPECIYGHRCPQSEPGKKTCFRGDSCRFEPVAHGIDTNIVKVTKV